LRVCMQGARCFDFSGKIRQPFGMHLVIVNAFSAFSYGTTMLQGLISNSLERIDDGRGLS